MFDNDIKSSQTPWNACLMWTLFTEQWMYGKNKVFHWMPILCGIVSQIRFCFTSGVKTLRIMQFRWIICSCYEIRSFVITYDCIFSNQLHLLSGLLKLQHLFSLVDHNRTLELRAVKRFANTSEANEYLREIEFNSTTDKKYVILECDAIKAKSIIITHVRDIYMGKRNFHFLLTSLVMDDYLNQKVSNN